MKENDRNFAEQLIAETEKSVLTATEVVTGLAAREMPETKLFFRRMLLRPLVQLIFG